MMDAKEKRKRVMARSIKIGHCVCDPRKPCPCPLFVEKNVCTCAGERDSPAASGKTGTAQNGKAVRLTEYVRSAGCASKIGQKDLHAVLSSLPVVEDPRLLVGMATADDAGVFRLASGVTVVQTVDVFTPGVDDPYLFGRIAACNSLSDVYAMGGTPITALSVIGFPVEHLPHEVMTAILRGGMDVLKEAGTVLLGGHSINDEEVKFGFAVTGLIQENAIITNAGAKPGDVLILTKPLGTGIISLANQIGRADPASVQASEESMSTLNRKAAEIMIRHHARACTDVTGFGFLGHLSRIVMESAVTAEIDFSKLPLLPGALEYAEQSIYSGAMERNSEYSAERTSFADGITEAMKAVLFDAQTSGGLLIAVPPEEADAMLADLHKAGVSWSVQVGHIVEKSEGSIRVLCNAGQTVKTNIAQSQQPENTMKKETTETACCSHDGAPAENTMAMFQKFMGAAMAPGSLDVVTKELLAVALGLAVNCTACTKIHLKKAKSMGIGMPELEEAAALAVAFAGCRAMMLWNEVKKDL
jgi:selenide, water dikinase